MAGYKLTFTFTFTCWLDDGSSIPGRRRNVFRSAIPSSSLTCTYVPCVEDIGGVRRPKIETATQLHPFPELRVGGEKFLTLSYVFVKSRLFLLFPVGPLLPTHCTCWGLLSHFFTLTRSTLGRTPVDEGSAHRRDIYLATHNTQNRHIFVLDGIRTRNPKKRAAADIHLKPARTSGSPLLI